MTLPEIEPSAAVPEATPEPAPVASGPLASGGGEDPGIKKARRVARVLVSDLKLYNERAVTEGARKGDLYNRLRDDLDRSYKHYQERVAGIIPENEINFFKEELIRQLGDGDPQRIGPMPF